MRLDAAVPDVIHYPGRKTQSDKKSVIAGLTRLKPRTVPNGSAFFVGSQAEAALFLRTSTSSRVYGVRALLARGAEAQAP